LARESREVNDDDAPNHEGATWTSFVIIEVISLRWKFGNKNLRTGREAVERNILKYAVVLETYLAMVSFA
jgi:hypothetical protein